MARPSEDVAQAGAPASDVDLFAPAVLRDPFPAYRTLRELGPAVHLTRLDVYAIGRFADVQRALRQPELFVSGQGVGFNDAFNNPPNPTVISSDGERHRRMRGTIAKPLAPAQLKASRSTLAGLIDAQVRALVNRGPFEAMSRLAQFLPVQAIAQLVGLENAGRERMLDWAAASFNSLGPSDGASRDDLSTMLDARRYLVELDPARLAPGSWADHLFRARDAGRLSDGEARGALAAYVTPSLDTTILSQGNLLFNLARNPDQWALIKRDPALIPKAVVEAVRHAAVVRWFSRVTAAACDVDGAVVPAGSRVMLMYGSANRDERRFADPDRFDVRREARDQLAWGTGPHLCAGMHLAQLEMEVLLEAMARHVDRLEADDPVVGANRGLYGFERLEMTLLAD